MPDAAANTIARRARGRRMKLLPEHQPTECVRVWRVFVGRVCAEDLVGVVNHCWEEPGRCQTRWTNGPLQRAYVQSQILARAAD